MRSGHHWDRMVETFEGCAAAGAELLSIESLGGKEIHDDALMMGDLPGVIFALCVLGVRDMQFLWPRIVQIAQRHHAVAAGDTACGFGNTAMVLAEQKSLPRVLAAVVRAVTAVRSLVAYECGAVGPGKDCGYENPFLKAITGFPMAMEGKSASCAHLSPVGNIAAATCDTWSNESVQNVRLLGAMAPICSLEQLVYDCRLMNQASADGPDAARQMQRWMVKSDAALDPQAFILQPESVIRVAAAIVAAPDYYHAGIAAARTALTLLRTAHAEGALRLSAMEVPWLNTLTDALDGMPDREDTFIRQMMSVVDTARFRAQDYQIDA
jgi:methanol--5-hydroxybenzimidazolylcobamide Co-methyltransferase